MKYILLFYISIVLLMSESTMASPISNFDINLLNTQAIDLSYRDLTSVDINKIAHNLKANTSLTQLTLTISSIGPNGAKSLVEGLKINTTLTQLNLGYNDIMPEGAECLAEALKINTTLIYLDLGGNDISCDGTKSLAEALKTNTTLTYLDLGNNDISCDGTKSLAEALKTNTTLTHLSLVYNSIGNKGIKSLIKSLSINTMLAKLDLNSNSIGDVGGKRMGEELKINTTLTQLFLRNNGIGIDGSKGFAEGLKINTTLTHLDLEYNNIGDEGAEHLAEGLKINTTLTHLSLVYNSIGNKGAKSLVETLKTNTTLTQLDLGCNRINNVIEQKIKDTLIFNQRFQNQKRHQSAQNIFILNLLLQDQEHASASQLASLAYAYLKGIGTSPNIQRAEQLLIQAVTKQPLVANLFIASLQKQFDPALAYIVGQAYASHGDYRDQAIHWHRLAAGQNYIPSQDALQHLMLGDLLPQAEKGDKAAQFAIYNRLYQSNQHDNLTDKALIWLKRSASQDHGPALLALAQHYQTGDVVKQDPLQAVKLYQQLLSLKHIAALPALEQLAKHGELEAQYVLGQNYAAGIEGIINQDDKQAIYWYQQAGNQKDSRALYALGHLYEQGRGTTLTTAKDILRLYDDIEVLYHQAQALKHPHAGEALAYIHQTLGQLKQLKEPELRRNILLKKLLGTLNKPLAPDLLYYAAHLTETMRLGFGDLPQAAVLESLMGIAQFPAQSQQARALMRVLLNLVDENSFNDDIFDPSADDFRVSQLGRICSGIYSLQHPSAIILPELVPVTVKINPDAIRDVRIEVFNSLFKPIAKDLSWQDFDQTVDRLMQQFNKGQAENYITANMLQDDEDPDNQELATVTDLKNLLKGGRLGNTRPSQRFGERLLKIEHILMHQLDDQSRYIQLASWAVAGLHCSTRAEQETYKFYNRYMTDTKTLDQEEASLELRLALILADVRKNLIAQIVSPHDEEPLHQIAHLEKKVAVLLALVGDAETFNDQYSMVVKSSYKNMTEQDIKAAVLQNYTPSFLINQVTAEINKDQESKLPRQLINKILETRGLTSAQLAEFYDEDVMNISPQGTKALLYSTGYLMEDLLNK